MLNSIDSFFELFLAIRANLVSRFKGCDYFLDVVDVVSDRLSFAPNFVEALIDATGRATELPQRNPPFSRRASVGSIREFRPMLRPSASQDGGSDLLDRR
jgi:hypothetical protein